jgi:hypothetical protein
MWQRRALVGPPLRASDASREQITSAEGLSALSLDALTWVAYGPEVIIVVLAAPGAGTLHLVLRSRRCWIISTWCSPPRCAADRTSSPLGYRFPYMCLIAGMAPVTEALP